MNVTVAISGGTDSLFALLHLKEEGHDVSALHARFLTAGEEHDAVPAMESLCRSLGISLRVVDLSEEFRCRVMEPFAEEHARARTPNPCALCNRAMKFGLLFDHAMTMGDAFATGRLEMAEVEDNYLHYRRIGEKEVADIFINRAPQPRICYLNGKEFEVNPMGFSVITNDR